MTTKSSAFPILVVDGTGKTGRRVARDAAVSGVWNAQEEAQDERVAP